MEHSFFKPRNFEDGKHAVVGNCNGIEMAERWKIETPLFAKEILKYVPEGGTILDYGCGVGRLAKEVLLQRPDVKVVGLDASAGMLKEAKEYVNSERFLITLPENLVGLAVPFDVVYCVYVLQHCPAIDLRSCIQRIHYTMKPEGKFVYCSSDYRMCITYDNRGFFDDRFLGVNIREEISRLFIREKELFDTETLDANPVLKTMIKTPGLPHPAYVYSQRKINVPYFDCILPGQDEVTQELLSKEKDVVKEFDTTQEVVVEPEIIKGGKRLTDKVILCNRLAPGDILVMTNVLRDLHIALPHLKIMVRTPCTEIFENSPHLSTFEYDNAKFEKINSWFQTNGKEDNNSTRVAYFDGITVIDMHYPQIHTSGTNGNHFCEGHGKFIEQLFGIKLNQKEIRPEIFLTQTEKDWLSPTIIKGKWKWKYWVINAGSKGDYTLKQYHRYQEVVDKFKDEIKFVQIGQLGHDHKPLDGAIDLRGKTSIRELFRLIQKSEGVLTCVSFPMHIAAAFSKPCVVVAGAREGTRWELYPNHQFIYLNGTLPCAKYDGCWRSKHSDCINMTEGGVPKCMRIITPEMVADRIRLYYDGGILETPAKKEEMATV